MQKKLSLIKNIASDQDITLEKGKELLSGIYEANFKLNKTINIAIVFSKMNDKFPLWYYQPKVVSLYIYALKV